MTSGDRKNDVAEYISPALKDWAGGPSANRPSGGTGKVKPSRPKDDRRSTLAQSFTAGREVAGLNYCYPFGMETMKKNTIIRFVIW